MSYFKVVHLDIFFLLREGWGQTRARSGLPALFLGQFPWPRSTDKRMTWVRKGKGRSKGKSAEWKSSQPCWCHLGLNLLEGICECGLCKDRDYWDEGRCPFQHATLCDPAARADSAVISDFLRTLWHYQNSADAVTSLPVTDAMISSNPPSPDDIGYPPLTLHRVQAATYKYHNIV